MSGRPEVRVVGATWYERVKAENAAMRAFIQKWAEIIDNGDIMLDVWPRGFCVEAKALLESTPEPSDG